MPAGPLVDRTDVEAGRAADAAKRLAPNGIGEHMRAAVVDEHDVDLLRTVAGMYPRPHRRVGVHPLAGRGTGQQLQEGAEVLPGRQDLLDPDHRDERLGQGEAHPAVALGLDDDQRARVGDGEVRPRDRDLGPEELLPQVQPAASASRRGSSVRSSGAGRPTRCISRRKISRISERLRWIAGTRMCEGRS
jgi:hypothetical protein